MFPLLFNEATKVERSEHLHAQSYERTTERHGQANGFTDKTLLTRSGALESSIPQVRDSEGFERTRTAEKLRKDKHCNIRVRPHCPLGG